MPEDQQPDSPGRSLRQGVSVHRIDLAAQAVERRLAEPPLAFDAGFENGSLDRVVRLGVDWYHIELRPDTWYRFHFRIKGCRGRKLVFEFTCRNINNPSYDEGKGRWTKSGGLVSPLVSYDGRAWCPVDHMEEHGQDPGKYRFAHAFAEDEAFLCHHHPYTYTDMLEWVKPLMADPRVRVDWLGETRNGFAQPVLTVADGPRSRDLVAIIGREDADENVASWAVEGLVRELLSDGLRWLPKQCVLKIVPMVGIDGVVAGAHHSAGYGYGGWRWRLDPSPREIENVKDAMRRWVAGGLRLRLAGKVHGPQCFTQDKGYDGILTPSAALKKEVEDGVARHSGGRWQPHPKRDLAIRPKGYFERFVLDEFGLFEVFATHVHGDSPDSAREGGAALMGGLAAWLERLG